MRISLLVAAVLLGYVVSFAQSSSESCDVHAWSDRDHFRDANAKLADQKPDRRVVMIAGSLIDGWDLGKSFPDKDYVNRAISGQGTAQMLLRFNSDVTQLHPRVVVILPGLDELSHGIAVADIQENLVAIAQLAKAHNIRVLYASLPPINPAGRNPVAAKLPPDKIRELNRWMFLYAKDHGDSYVDLWSPLGDEKAVLRPEFSADGITLNDAAFKAIAPVLEKRISEALVAPIGRISVKGD